MNVKPGKVVKAIKQLRKMTEFKKSNRTEIADSIIKNHIVWSMGAGAIPIPFADMVAVTAVQLDMVKQLARVYDLDYKEAQGKAIITSLSGSAMASFGKRAVKFIPGIGSILGGIAMATLSGASTYALGEVFKKHFETGGTFLDFDPNRLQKYYREKFEKGKEVADELQKKSPKKEAASANSDAIAQLKDLAEMKKDGILSDEEFEKMKAKILG